uniref:Uncharacterized protein n=1 Tax=Salix viminalis TaxID=40686 RepID=A0A6N2LQ81_SALVM
MSKRGLSCSQ